MEYAVSAWKPRLRRDIDALESPEKSVKGAIRTAEIDWLGYDERLSAVQITALEERRYR